MKKLVQLTLILILAYPLTGIIMTSCAGESDCSMAGRPSLFVEFKNNINNVIVNDTLDSLTVTALYTDSIILNKERNKYAYEFPLRYTSDSTILILHYSRTRRDTVTIRHTNSPKFVSMECGYEMKQEIIDITHSFILLDSIRILNKNTNTNGTKNLELFLKDI